MILWFKTIQSLAAKLNSLSMVCNGHVSVNMKDCTRLAYKIELRTDSYILLRNAINNYIAGPEERLVSFVFSFFTGSPGYMYD